MVDIPLSLLPPDRKSTQINLLLYDHRSDMLYYLGIPTEFFLTNWNRLDIRTKIRLELAADDSSQFQNVRPAASGLHFVDFKRDVF